jgi:septum formation protein
MKGPLFVLASKSPRRKELLNKIGINAQVIPSNVDEDAYKGLEAEKMVMQLSFVKAADVARSFRKNTFVIGADTCVCLEGKIFGKPESKDDAKRMLEELSGKTHQVYTGYCVIDCGSGKSVSRCAVTNVTFKELTESEIEAYVETGEPLDKAGAYGIQEKGAVFVEKIDGDYSNVVGLPLSPLYKLFKEEFMTDLF